jgi:N-succinyl-L-ornithine transcarbamylase
MKHFTSVADVENMDRLIDQALLIKKDPRAWMSRGSHKTLGLFFFQPSLRTRISTQKAASMLGMNVIVMNVGQDGWQLEFEDGVVMNGDKAEHIREAAAVMGQYCDIIGVRSFAGLTDREKDYREETLSAFQKYAGVPVISLESATRHPLQSLADLITLKEHAPSARNPRIVLSWAPHPRALPQAVANSFAEWILAAGYELTITHPAGYELDPRFTEGARIEHDQKAAFSDADFVYVKNWSSWKNYGQVLSTDPDWTVGEEHFQDKSTTKVMHCLPVRRNVVIRDEILDGPRSLVIPQAANRVWSAAAVLDHFL